jgi:hypothetical protein
MSDMAAVLKLLGDLGTQVGRLGERIDTLGERIDTMEVRMLKRIGAVEVRVALLQGQSRSSPLATSGSGSGSNVPPAALGGSSSASGSGPGYTTFVAALEGWGGAAVCEARDGEGEAGANKAHLCTFSECTAAFVLAKLNAHVAALAQNAGGSPGAV